MSEDSGDGLPSPDEILTIHEEIEQVEDMKYRLASGRASKKTANSSTRSRSRGPVSDEAVET